MVEQANKRDIQIWDPNSTTGQVFGGKIVNLQATRMRFTKGSFVPVPQEPAKDTSNSYQTNLSYGDFVGMANAKITVDGVINVEDPTPGPVDNSPITWKILLQFVKAGRVYKLRDVYDASKSSTPNAGYYRIHGLDSNENPTDFDVMIVSIKSDSNASITDGQKIPFTVEFVEVRV